MALKIAWMEDEKWKSIQWLGWTILTSVNPRQSGTDTVTGWRIWGLMKQGQILWLFLLVVVQREDWTNFVIRAFSVLINSWNKIQAIIQLLIISGPKSLQSGEFSGRIFPDPHFIRNPKWDFKDPNPLQSGFTVFGPWNPPFGWVLGA